MGRESLAVLVEATRGGDRDAFGELVARFQDMAVASAYARLRDADLARDAAQEAFTDAYLHLAQLREPAAFPGWFRRIVTKHCDRLTRRKQLGTASLESSREPAAPHADPGAALEERQRRALLRTAIEGLPEHERIVVALYYVAGEAQDAIGAYLELPVSTIKKRLHSARARLKERSFDMTTEALAGLRPSSSPEFSARIQLLVAVRSGDVGRAKAILDEAPELADSEEDWEFSDSLEHDLPIPARATPLIRAAERGDLPMIELLLAAGASLDRDCGCSTRESALWAAATNGRTEAALRLLAAGADPDAAASQGHTPLHVAAIRGDLELAHALVRAGADTEVRPTTNGRTALDWARLKEHANVVELLEQEGLEREGLQREGLEQEALEREGSDEAPDRRRASSGPNTTEDAPVLPTGIKALDLFAPIVRGALVRCHGAAGVGRNVLVAEWAHNVTRLQGGAAIFVAWERLDWERGELEGLVAEAGLEGSVELLCAGPDDPSERRHTLAEEALRRAHALGEAGSPDVLLVFFEREGCASDVESVYPRLGASRGLGITTLVVSDWRDFRVAERRPLAPPFGALWCFDTALAAIHHYPSIHPLWSESKSLRPEIVGERHCALAERSRALISGLRELDPALNPPLGDASAETARALRLQAFLTQPFHTAESFSGGVGSAPTLEQTLGGVEAILAGNLDHTEPRRLAYRGALSDAEARHP